MKIVIEKKQLAIIQKDTELDRQNETIRALDAEIKALKRKVADAANAEDRIILLEKDIDSKETSISELAKQLEDLRLEIQSTQSYFSKRVKALIDDQVKLVASISMYERKVEEATQSKIESNVKVEILESTIRNLKEQIITSEEIRRDQVRLVWVATIFDSAFQDLSILFCPHVAARGKQSTKHYADMMKFPKSYRLCTTINTNYNRR